MFCLLGGKRSLGHTRGLLAVIPSAGDFYPDSVVFPPLARAAPNKNSPQPGRVRHELLTLFLFRLPAVILSYLLPNRPLMEPWRLGQLLQLRQRLDYSSGPHLLASFLPRAFLHVLLAFVCKKSKGCVRPASRKKHFYMASESLELCRGFAFHLT